MPGPSNVTNVHNDVKDIRCITQSDTESNDEADLDYAPLESDTSSNSESDIDDASDDNVNSDDDPYRCPTPTLHMGEVVPLNVIDAQQQQPSEVTTSSRKIARNKRMAGKEYVGYVRKSNKIKQNQIRPARVQGVICSSLFCAKSKFRHCSDFSSEERENMFLNFWAMTWEQKELYINNLIECIPIKHHKVDDGYRRQTRKLII